MASGMTSGKRFAVRLSLVTSSTVAMIIGAQSLATLNQVNAAPVDNIVSVPVVQVTPIVHAAPSITIIRRAGTTTTASANTSGTTTAAPTTAMQAPVPIVLSPAQQAQQQMTIPRTRSSR